MNTQLLAEKIVKNAIKLGADEAEVYLETNRNFNLTVRNQEVENIKQATSNGLGLRLFKEKREGFSYTSDLSDRSLEAFVKRAVQLTLIGEPRPWNGLADFEKGDLKNLDLYDPSIPELPNEKKLEIAKKVPDEEDDFMRWQGENKEKNTIVEFFENSPLYDSGIDLERNKDLGREVKL